MAEEKQKIKRVPIEKLFAEHFKGSIFKNNRIYKVTDKTNGSNGIDYMIITNDGFEIYSASKKVENNEEVLEDVRLIKSLTWSDFQSVKVDKFALTTLYDFDNEFKLQVDSNDLIKQLQDNGITTILLERKWYNKILGFRSKKKWKMAIASLLYLVILIAAIDGFTESDTEKVERVAAETKAAEEKAALEAEQKAKEAERIEKEKQEKLAEEKKAKQEKDERDSLIMAFQLASDKIVEESNGIIPEVTIEDASNYFQVNVYVDEATWAQSNESEKSSFATTVGTSIENALAPHSTYVDIRSATNKDVVASQKMFGGWKIKR